MYEIGDSSNSGIEWTATADDSVGIDSVTSSPSNSREPLMDDVEVDSSASLSLQNLAISSDEHSAILDSSTQSSVSTSYGTLSYEPGERCASIRVVRANIAVCLLLLCLGLSTLDIFLADKLADHSISHSSKVSLTLYFSIVKIASVVSVTLVLLIGFHGSLGFRSKHVGYGGAAVLFMFPTFLIFLFNTFRLFAVAGTFADVTSGSNSSDSHLNISCPFSVDTFSIVSEIIYTIVHTVSVFVQTVFVLHICQLLPPTLDYWKNRLCHFRLFQCVLIYLIMFNALLWFRHSFIHERDIFNFCFINFYFPHYKYVIESICSVLCTCFIDFNRL